MKKCVIAVHGGASENSPFLRKHTKEIKEGLLEALQVGYKILQKGGTALDAVEKSVILLEDNPLFNAGKGSALNAQGEVEMDASIMDGKTLDAGGVSMVTHVKNPIVLARTVMHKTNHVFLSGYGALALARNKEICLEVDSYFFTDYQYSEFEKRSKHETIQKILEKRTHGTVGAVALDKKGNVAAATSTGGTANCLPGRVGDSCIIGAGCYANNNLCAVSGTGEGEYLITRVVGHSIAILSEHKSLQEACDAVVPKYKKGQGIGVISVNRAGEIGIQYNTKIMKRAWVGLDKQIHVAI